MESTDEKVPVAEFITDKPEYIAGETVQLINTSTDAETYRWTLPNGATTKSKDVSFATASSTFDTKVLFKLEAISKSGLKSDYVVKEITVRTPTGTLMLFNSFSLTQNRSIYIDTVYYGAFSFPGAQSSPACGQSGYTSFNLKAGTHVLTFSASGAPPRTFEIKRGTCAVVDIS